MLREGEKASIADFIVWMWTTPLTMKPFQCAGDTGDTTLILA